MSKKSKFTKANYLTWYESMLLMRKFEEKCGQLYIQQKFGGFLHLYIGQEAVAAGTISACTKDDKHITAYRDHAHPIGLGLHPKYVLAELYGKATGSSKGKGGSMHIFSKEYNFMGGHGIVGGQIPLGAGMAFGDKYFERDNVTLCYLGDGASRQGSLHETLNLAMLWQLPVVFVVENNGYAMGTSVARTSNHEEIWKLGLGYDMPCEPCDGMDPVEVAKTMSKAIGLARSGGGPSFIEMKTYRYRGHSMSDAQHYRTKAEVEEYRKIDPITQVKEVILSKKYATLEELDKVDKDIKARVLECEKFAESSPYPDSSLMYDAVYEQEDYPFIKHKL